MTPELRYLVEGQIRHLLHRQGPRPLMLREAQLHTDPYGGRSYLRLVLVDGTIWNVDLRGERFAHWGAGDDRLFSQECVRLYSQLYEDRLLERELRASAERVHRLAMDGAHRDQVRQAYHEHEEFERHLRQHHRVRRDNPMMPVEPYPSTGTAGPEPDGTLTIESLQRAMRAMQAVMPRAEGRYYDEVGDGQAQARALALFKGRLSAEQLAQYERERRFEVIGCDTGKRYRIRHGRQMNIDELDAKGERVCGWCFLPQGGLAAGDVMLAQKIALECDEAAALKVANRFGNTSEGDIPYRSARLTAEDVRGRFAPLVGEWMT